MDQSVIVRHGVEPSECGDDVLVLRGAGEPSSDVGRSVGVDDPGYRAWSEDEGLEVRTEAEGPKDRDDAGGKSAEALQSLSQRCRGTLSSVGA